MSSSRAQSVRLEVPVCRENEAADERLDTHGPCVFAKITHTAGEGFRPQASVGDHVHSPVDKSGMPHARLIRYRHSCLPQ